MVDFWDSALFWFSSAVELERLIGIGGLLFAKFYVVGFTFIQLQLVVNYKSVTTIQRKNM